MPKTFLFSLFFFILLLKLVSSRIGYESFPSNMDTTTQTFSDPNSNPASCPCDLRVSICDTFCCCDGECSSDTITRWKNSNVCAATSMFLIMPANPKSISNVNSCEGSSLYGMNSY